LRAFKKEGYFRNRADKYYQAFFCSQSSAFFAFSHVVETSLARPPAAPLTVLQPEEITAKIIKMEKTTSFFIHLL